jgi:DNA/RNA-binding domain of Phe-tRNA-synthetase-like protein
VLSNRFTGGQAIVLRQKPVPWSYRVFFRHIGLDPDRTHTPIEALALDRMQRGRFRSRNLLDDALTIAIAETGVAVCAFDADKVSGRVGIRAVMPGEALEGRPGELPPGTLAIADSERPLALLFGAMAQGRGVHPRTRRTLFVAVQVKGVPEIAIEEALWLASTTMLSVEE